MLEKFLQDIGLSDKEAKIYLALLGVDSYSVAELATKTGVNRTTVYPLLNSLMEKKLVVEVKLDKKTHYQAESPERIETYVKNQQTRLEEQSKILSEIIPRMKSISRETGEKAIVKYMDGREGILNSINDYYSKGDEGGTAYLFYSRDLIQDVFGSQEVLKAKSTRISRKILTKSIYNYSKGEIPSDETGERIRIDENKYPIKCDIAIYKDKVRIHTLGKNLSAIFIKSQDVADSLKTLFEIAFESLKEKK